MSVTWRIVHYIHKDTPIDTSNTRYTYTDGGEASNSAWSTLSLADHCESDSPRLPD